MKISTGVLKAETIFDLAHEVIALARDERVWRSLERRNVDMEDFLLPRWDALMATGEECDCERVLCDGIGYISPSRAAFRPANPAYTHETAKNCDWAESLLAKLWDSRAGVAHGTVQQLIGARFPGTECIPHVIIPLQSCYSAYQWFRHGDLVVAFKPSQGDTFTDYAVMHREAAEEYAALYSRVAAKLGNLPVL